MPTTRLRNTAAPATAPQEAWERVLRRMDLDAEGPEAGAQGYAEFELDFEQALARQLGPFFEKLEPLELTPQNIRGAVKPRARGAYYLILSGRVVYIGKSDAESGLQMRLVRHYKTLKRRRNIDWTQMKFKSVKVSSLAALDTESLLLDLFKRRALEMGSARTELKPEWNFSGFGSNDTGAERDTQRVSIFDQKHPLDLDAEVEFEGLPAAATMALSDYLVWLAKQLQFVFRRQKMGIPTDKLLTSVPVTVAEMTRARTMRALLRAVHSKLPAGWVLTVLRGKVVLYLNDRNAYKSPLWRLVAGAEPGEPTYELGDVGTAEAGADEE